MLSVPSNRTFLQADCENFISTKTEGTLTPAIACGPFWTLLPTVVTLTIQPAASILGGLSFALLGIMALVSRNGKGGVDM